MHAKPLHTLTDYGRQMAYKLYEPALFTTYNSDARSTTYDSGKLRNELEDFGRRSKKSAPADGSSGLTA